MHARGTGVTGDGRRVESLACDEMPGSVALLRLDDLSVTDLNGGWLR
ncbi:hypothetical protein [Microbacterium sp. NPDC096154]